MLFRKWQEILSQSNKDLFLSWSEQQQQQTSSGSSLGKNWNCDSAMDGFLFDFTITLANNPCKE